jgi:hypothetical protein
MADNFNIEDTGIPDSLLSNKNKGGTLVSVLQDFGNDLTTKLKKNLQNSITTVTSKSLEQSIEFTVKFISKEEVKFELLINDYYEFVDEGVQGVGGMNKAGTLGYVKKNTTSPFTFRDKKPPLDALKNWSTWNNVNPFAVQNSVFHRGIKATNFYSSVVNQKLLNDLYADIQEVGGEII